LIALWAGLVAGLFHVASGPDHWAAVAPLAADRSHSGRALAAARVGAAWGLGHGLAVALVAILGQTTREALGLEAWSARAESLVGFLLVGLAVWGWRRARRLEVASEEKPHTHSPAAMGIGLLHGLAGASHWIAASPTLVLGPADAARYVTGYWFAAVLAMSAFAAMIGSVAPRLGPSGVPRILRGSALLALAVGGVWIARAFA
jgi:hypothetical protein